MVIATAHEKFGLSALAGIDEQVELAEGIRKCKKKKRLLSGTDIIK